jgi:hypothetical protein
LLVAGETACLAVPFALIAQICTFPPAPLALVKTIRPLGALAAEAALAHAAVTAREARKRVIRGIVAGSC